MVAIHEQVIFRRGTDRRCQTGAEFLLQKPDHLAHALQRETTASKLTDHRDCYQFIPTVDSPMTLSYRSHNSALIPPLQLPSRDSSQRDHVVGCELPLHHEPNLFQTINDRNV